MFNKFTLKIEFSVQQSLQSYCYCISKKACQFINSTRQLYKVCIVLHEGTPCSAYNAAYYQKGKNFFNNPCPIATMFIW